MGYLVNYLASDVVGEPIKAFVETFPRCGTGALNVPVKGKTSIKGTFYRINVMWLVTTLRTKL